MRRIFLGGGVPRNDTLRGLKGYLQLLYDTNVTAQENSTKPPTFIGGGGV
jgi:hypothetical protein